jgi:predicted TIM-barrel fold metal-dependent hydrolase
MDRYLVISSDGHAGLPPERYRDYLEPQYRAVFDERIAEAIRIRKENEKFFLISDFNNAWREQNWEGLVGAWDPAAREKVLDADGVAAEVLFPDGITERNSPPFGADLGLRPEGADPELQWAGARAHNRWLAEFCATAPERRIGLALIPVYWDVEENMKAIRWAKDNGLKGLMFPAVVDGYDSYNHPKYDPMWALIEDLGLVINFHSGGTGRGYDRTSPGWVGIFCCEYPFYMTRALFAFIFGGVFDRFPRLKVAFTEVGGDFWWPPMIELMDFRAAVKKGSAKMGDHASKLSMKPSEFFARNVWVGSSAQLEDARPDSYYQIGMDRVMWGTDYPHPEGTWPNTAHQMVGSLRILSDEDRAAVFGLNAVKLYDLDLAALNAIAARIGPKKSMFLPKAA